MADDKQPNFLDEIYNEIVSGLETFTKGSYEKLVEVLGPVLVAVVTLYIVVQGIRIFMGYNETSVSSFAKKALLLGFVTVLATNWGVFQELIVNTIMNTPEALIKALITGNESNPEPGSTRNFFSTFLDQSLALFIQVFKEGGLTNFAPYIIGLIGIIAVSILVAAIFILLITAQVSLSVLLTLAPLIIPTYLFESTRNICMSWARMLITSMFVPILVYAITGLFMGLLEKQLEELQGDISMYSIIAYAITVVISLILVKQVPTLASAIGSGVTYASAGAAPTFAASKLKAGFAGIMNKLDGHLQKQKTSLQQDKLSRNNMQEVQMSANSSGVTNSNILLDEIGPISKLSGYGR